MNFLFTTVLVLLLVAPGLLFFRTYYAGRFSIRYSNLTITDQVFRSIVPGLLLQLVAFWLIQVGSADGTYVRLEVLGTLLLGAKEDKTVREAFGLLREQLGAVLLYYGGMLAGGTLLGWGTRTLVRWRKWDRRYEWLRYDNQWHYLLSGEILETPDLEVIELEDAGRIDFVFVDVLMKLEKSNMLYSGILAGYELAADGGLRTIYLRNTRRKQLLNGSPKPAESVEPSAAAPGTTDLPAAEEDTQEDYYPVLGDLMVIPYTQLLNLNLTYYIDEEDAQDEGDDTSGTEAEYEIHAVDATPAADQEN